MVKKTIFFLMGTVIVYLMITGISSTMMYSVTPTELLSGEYTSVVRVDGHVIKGSYTSENNNHKFLLTDSLNTIIFVEYTGNLPATFTDESEIIAEGRFIDNILEVNDLFTKCGSRYEASPEELS